MKKTLSFILTLCMLISSVAVTASEVINPFVDVPEDAWYHDEVVGAV